MPNVNQNDVECISENQFDSALGVITVTEQLNPKNYDALLVKKMAGSNVVNHGDASTRQTHIAITGEQMKFFPHLHVPKYRAEGGPADSAYKGFFSLMLNCNILKTNAEKIGLDLDFQGRDSIPTRCTTVLSHRQNQSDQQELSVKQLDGEEFKEFLKKLKKDDLLVMLKRCGKLEFDLLDIPKIESDEYYQQVSQFKSLLIRKGSRTPVFVDSFLDFSETELNIPRNLIFFGAPGTGKSFRMKNECLSFLRRGGDFERVTFHSDYTYSQFVGTYKPVSEDDGMVKYRFVPGPFMRVLAKAMAEKYVNHILLIEEINRAPVSGVFGDVFQLLDRAEDGSSEYEIHPPEEMKEYLVKQLGDGDYETIKIPGNMFIWATMNSADQGVFQMDTAFKRRWDFRYLGINEAVDSYPDQQLWNRKFTFGKGENEKHFSWNSLRKAINEELASNRYNISEDKQLGPFFLSKTVLDGTPEGFLAAFKNKVLMYLFEDAVMQKRSQFFQSCINTQGVVRYSEICKKFDEEGVMVFPEGVRSILAEENQTQVE